MMKKYERQEKSHFKANIDQGAGSSYTTGPLSDNVPDAKGHKPTNESRAAEGQQQELVTNI